MLFPTEAAGHVAIHVHAPTKPLQHCDAFQFYRIHLAYAETLLVQTDLSRRVALLFRMYSLSKDIYDK